MKSSIWRASDVQSEVHYRQWIRQVEPKFNKLNSHDWSKADDGFSSIDSKDDHKPPNQAIDPHDGCWVTGSSSGKY